jgi:hypothetical protein
MRLPVYKQQIKMKTSFFRPVIAGILIGAALFFFGFFILRILLMFIVIAAIFRFFIRRSFRRKFGNGYYRRFQHGYRHDEYAYGDDAVINLRRKENARIIQLD